MKKNKILLKRFVIFAISIVLFRLSEAYLPDAWWSMIIEFALGGTAIYIAAQLLRSSVLKDETDIE